MQVKIQVGGKDVETLNFAKPVGHPVISDYIQHSQVVRGLLGGKLARTVVFSNADKEGNYSANVTEPASMRGPNITIPAVTATPAVPVAPVAPTK